MKREIKFRAWDNIRNLMFYNVENGIDLGMYFSFGQMFPKTEMIDFELMQYTGLKDCNGKEIYEGDIVKRSAGKFGDVISQVEYNNLTAMFTIKLEDQEYNDECLSDYDYEVIGNIYENPELL